MSAEINQVPFRNSSSGGGLLTIEDLEWRLTEEECKPFMIFPNDEPKRQIFRRNFESSAAVANRQKMQRSFGGESWDLARRFSSLSEIAAITEIKKPITVDDLFNTTAENIRQAREEIGGEIARLIEAGELKKLVSIFKNMENPIPYCNRKNTILNLALRAMREAGKLLTMEELRSLCAPDQDISNYSERMKAVGFGGLPKWRSDK